VIGALRLLVGRSLRVSRRAILGLAVVVALAGGVSLAALAAARRTDSAFPRYLEASRASDLAINVVRTEDVPSDLSDVLEFGARARMLPQVEADATYVGLEGMVITRPDDPDQPTDVQPEILGSLDGRFLDQDTIALTSGRLPAARAEDEIVVNQRAARTFNLEVGAQVDLAAFRIIDEETEEFEILGRVQATVVGIGQFPDEVLGDDIDGSERLLTAPALTERYLDDVGSYAWQGIRLAPGASVDETIAAYQGVLDDGWAMNVQRTDVQRDRVHRAVRPVVAALTAFGTVAGLAALALGALGALRLIAAARSDVTTLRALGVSSRTAGAAVAAPALVAALLGAIGAAGMAIALSPLSPVGPVRDVEPAPGMDLDGAVLLGGSVAMVAILGAVVALAAGAAVRRPRSAHTDPARPSTVLAALAAIGLGPAPIIGTRHALGVDARRDGVPTRSTVVACTLSVVAMASALTFGAGVRQLINEPNRYGWAADLAISSGGGYDEMDLGGAAAAAATGEVDGLTIAGFGPLQIGGIRVSAMGIDPVEGPALVTLVSGRVPSSPGEVALGASSASLLHADTGDTLDAAGGPLAVVGIVALPAIGPLASTHPSLGQGALMTIDGLMAQTDRAYPSLVLLDLADGVDRAEATPRLIGAMADTLTHLPAGYATAYEDLRPAEVVGLQPARRTANILAGLLGVAALLALVLTLSASVRRRGATFAILSSIGFGRRDLRRTVRWQTNVVAVVALALGLPLGVVAGRAAWAALADQLGVATDSPIPAGLLALAGGAVLVVANLVGEGPARRAARTSAHVLRSA
jgi:hypothetical protein